MSSHHVAIWQDATVKGKYEIGLLDEPLPHMLTTCQSSGSLQESKEELLLRCYHDVRSQRFNAERLADHIWSD